jgi:CheY-like chemotaxis protein
MDDYLEELTKKALQSSSPYQEKLYKMEKELEEKEKSLAKLKRRKRENKKILAVDDVETNLVIIQFLLEEEGYMLVSAKNGKEAVDIYREDKNIHIVCMDMNMPVMNGVEATRLIREIEKEEGRVPARIIAVTAYDKKIVDKNINSDTFYSAGMKVGIDSFVIKPVKIKELIDKIEDDVSTSSRAL